MTILVADNGPGVPDRARAHLFAAFQGSARPGGTGLGLAIAAELVRLHGGTDRARGHRGRRVFPRSSSPIDRSRAPHAERRVGGFVDRVANREADALDQPSGRRCVDPCIPVGARSSAG